MKKSDFDRVFPGHLVPTVAWEHRPGTRVAEQVNGFAFDPDPLPPKLEIEVQTKLLGLLTKPLIQATDAVATLKGRASRLENPHLLIGPFLRREARLSSKIEDTIATPYEIALVDAGGPSEDDEAWEVTNYIRALEHGLMSHLPFTRQLFCEMHRCLLSGVRGNETAIGQYRTLQNHIGRKQDGFEGARFVPPPPGLVMDRAMQQLCDYMNEEENTWPNLLRIALTHYQFETIHPFEDGNGRLGRVTIALQMCRYKLLNQPLLYLSAFFEQNKDEYKDRLRSVSTHGDWEGWLRFFLNAVTESATEADSRADSLLALWQRYAVLVTGPRNSSLLRKIVDMLFASPVISTQRIRKELGISNTAAVKNINLLISIGIIQEMSVPGRKKYYIAREIIAVSEEG